MGKILNQLVVDLLHPFHQIINQQVSRLNKL
jgi:hypothetical protein